MGLLLLSLWTSPAFGAYRVFKHRIYHYDYAGKRVGKPTMVLSTLDHLQYEHYHGGYRWMKVEMVDTWYCPGDTSRFRKFCRKVIPKNRAPSSLRNDPKRVLPYNRQPIIP